jgi:hypothetical protein
MRMTFCDVDELLLTILLHAFKETDAKYCKGKQEIREAFPGFKTKLVISK